MTYLVKSVFSENSAGLSGGRVAAAFLGLGTLLAGCASEPAARDPYAAAAYTGAPQEYDIDHVAPRTPPPQTIGADATPLLAESYEGIAGARRAHQLYEAAVAEKLDGRCEPFVRVSADENLVDIADYCDIPVASLVNHNPTLENPYLVEAGLLVEIPGVAGAEGYAGSLDMADELVGLYSVRPGDTLEKVAFRQNVSIAQLVQLNPQARWRELRPGERIRAPFRSAAEAAARTEAEAVMNKPWEGYATEAVGEEGDVDALDAAVAAHMPYNDRPRQPILRSGDGPLDARLLTDKSVVRQGRPVTVTLTGVPEGALVTFYRGKNTGDMSGAETVRAGSDQTATATFKTPRKQSDMGGYIYKATRADTGETYYSERVGVLKLESKSAAGGGDEAGSEE